MEYDVIAYIDGACKSNPGIGGWGVCIIGKDGMKDFYGGEYNTTNNRMELVAAIKAIEQCPNHASKILIYTDSQYVVKGISEWINGWKQNGWKTAKNDPIKNKDLWIILDNLCNKYNTTWQWVKGHSTSQGNNRADILANRGMNELLK